MDEKGFLGTLFDLSFESFISFKIIKFFYFLYLFISTSGTILFIILVSVSIILKIFFEKDPLFAEISTPELVVMLILTPVPYLFFLCLVRIWFELMVIIFKLLEYTGKTAENTSELIWQQRRNTYTPY